MASRRPSIDKECVRRAQQGDADALKMVRAWAVRVVHSKTYGFDRDEQEDIVQNVLEDVWSRLRQPGFRLQRSLEGLVATIAIRRSIDAIRARRPTGQLHEGIEDGRPDPYSALLLADQAARLRWALQQLDLRCRKIIKLRILDHRSYLDIGRELSVVEGTVRVHMRNCRLKLEDLLRRWDRDA